MQRRNIQRATPEQRKDRMRKKLASTKGPKTICLNSIVKNESNNMVRLLDSVKSIVDMISIVDTGSTDNTIDIILTWGKENNIPTTVHCEPFKNFCYNRTHSLQMAKKAYPMADYFLLSDADFVWNIDVNNKFDKALLIDHKYLIEQYNPCLSYWNIRLLSSKVDFHCVARTHEYWTETKDQSTYTGDIRTTKITTLKIDDKEDGGCKADKFTRDERLLREGLEDPLEPDYLKTRYKFYLAQTLKDMGRFEESIEWYKKRILDKGWEEEIYYSKFQIGFNYEQMGWNKKHCTTLLDKGTKEDIEQKFILKWNPNNISPAEILEESKKYFLTAADYYLEAYSYRKIRSESLYYLTKMYRSLGMNEQAFPLAIMGNKIPFPKTDTLFIQRNCYDYLFDCELSIIAFYIPGKRDIGRQAIVRLLEKDNLPEDKRHEVEQNSRCYI